MKKVIFFLLGLLILQSGIAQVQNGNFYRVSAKDSIWLAGRWVKQFSGDTALTEKADNVVPTQAAVRKFVDAAFLSQYANITYFGAKEGASAAVNNAAIVAAIATKKSVFIPPGRFTVSQTFSLNPGQSIFGVGPQSIIATTANDTLFIANHQSKFFNFRMVGNATLGGTWPNFTSNASSQYGIVSSNVADVGVQQITVDSMGRAGIYISNPVSNTYDGNVISNCYGTANFAGFWSSTFGEYVVISNCQFNSGRYGMVITGGNVSINGGQCSKNRIGVYVTGGPNHGHSGITGMKINHNLDFSVWVSSVTLGYRFVNCDMYYGGVYLDVSNWVVFESCDIDVTGYTFYDRGGRSNYLKNCRLMGTNFTYNPDFAGVPSQLFFENCQDFTTSSAGGSPTGAYANNIKGGYLEVEQVGADISFGAGTNSAIALDSIRFNAISMNLSYKVDTFYNFTNGRITNKGYGYGNLDIMANFIVATPDPDNVQIALVSDGLPLRVDTFYCYPRKSAISGEYEYYLMMPWKHEPNKTMYFTMINNSASAAVIRKRKTRIIVTGL